MIRRFISLLGPSLLRLYVVMLLNTKSLKLHGRWSSDVLAKGKHVLRSQDIAPIRSLHCGGSCVANGSPCPSIGRFRAIDFYPGALLVSGACPLSIHHHPTCSVFCDVSEVANHTRDSA